MWIINDEMDVERARVFFMNHMNQGWLVAKKNSELLRVFEFKPDYGELWFIPLVHGG